MCFDASTVRHHLTVCHDHTVNRRMDEWVEIDQLNLATLDTEAVGKDDKLDDKK